MDVLQTLGVHHFDICLVAIGKDFQSSMVVTALLRELDAQYIVSKAESDIQADLLMKIGAYEIVYPSFPETSLRKSKATVFRGRKRWLLFLEHLTGIKEALL